jgi:CheY-like chemotaxis protein
MNIFNQVLHIDNRSFPRVNDNIKAAEKVNLLCHSFSNALFDPVVEYLRVMRYNVVAARDFAEVVERSDKSNVVIFTDVDNNAFEKITTAADLKVRVFSIGQSRIECEKLIDNEFIPARMMLFDAGKENERKEIGKSSSMVMSRFPVDLRNVDMALASLLNNCQTEVPLNELGAFKPAEHNLTIDGSVVAEHKCLIVHARPEVRKRFRDGVLSGMSTIGIEEANAGDIAYNLAKTMKEELSYIFIDLKIPIMTCFDVVKKIMELPNHKRVKFIIVYNKATREEFVPFIKLGVRHFLPEDSVDMMIKKKFEEMRISG